MTSTNLVSLSPPAFSQGWQGKGKREKVIKYLLRATKSMSHPDPLYDPENSLPEDIETVFEFVERWNKKDEEVDVANAANRVETWLATYKPNV